jgi:quinol monooxygenase YgiN
MTDEHAHLIRVAKYRADPGRHEQLLARMQDLAAAMRDLPGLFGVQVCRIAGAPEWVVLIARWRDEAAVQGIVGTRAADLTYEVVGLADEESIEQFVAVQ